jgi:aminoglycoside 6'-N-acetyltransferase
MEITLHPVGPADLPLLSRWESAPHVARWWQEPSDLASVVEKYTPRIEGRDPTEMFVIEVDGDPAGMVQRYRHRDDEAWDRAIGIPGAAGIDYYIGDETLIGRGIGTAVISAFARGLFDDYLDIDCVVAAPQQANVASWRALEKAGFDRVWSGQLDSDDPSDAGPAFVYVLYRASSDLDRVGSS